MIGSPAAAPRRMLVTALMGLVALALLASAGTADAKNRRVGTYNGTIETGGTVSFRFTKKRKIVGFTAADVPRYCRESGVFQRSGTVTFSAPTMNVQGAGRFFYSNLGTIGNFPPISIEVNGKPNSITRNGLKGYLIQNDTTRQSDPTDPQEGEGFCTTYRSDWTARKVGGK